MKFLPTPSARRATGGVQLVPVLVQFLPTPSARRATLICYGISFRHVLISTHALREEGDLYSVKYYDVQTISTHALREEGDKACRLGWD